MTVPHILADLTAGRHPLSVLDENFAYLDGRGTYVQPGNADDTATLQAAIDAVSAAGGGTVTLLAGTFNVAGVVLKSNVYLKGAGRGNTILKLKNSANVDVLYGLNAYTLFGTLSTGGIYDWGLSDLTIDGNRANNTLGNGLAVYGYRYTLENVIIQNCAERGVRSEGGQPVANAMEATIRNVLIDTTGQQGAYFNGPHDSMIDNLIIIDAGQSANNSYDALFFDTYMNARVRAFHGWHRATVTNRVRAQFFDTAGTSNFTQSHFEGAYFANMILAGSNSSFDASNMYYAAWNGLNVVIRGPGNTLMGVLMAASAGRPASVGVTLGFGSDNAGANKIDVNVWSNFAGAVDFTHSTGNNSIRVSGYAASGPKYLGTPAATDTVDLIMPGGATGSDLHSIATGSSYQISGTTVLSRNTTTPNGSVSYAPFLLTGAATDWLQTYAYGDNGTPAVSLSTVGGAAIAGASRASEAAGAASSPIGVMGWGFTDGSSGHAGYPSWGGYFEARKYTGATGYAQGIEVDVANCAGSYTTIHPYDMSHAGATIGVWVASGGNYSALAPLYNPSSGLVDAVAGTASVAIGVTNNGADFKKGLVFGYNAINGADGTDSGGAGTAIQMARGHEINWAVGNGSGGVLATIRSDVTTTGIGQKLVFSDIGPLFQDGAGTTKFQFYTPSGTFDMPAGGNIKISGTQVVGARDTGWAAMTGTPNKAAVYDTATVTLAQLAGRVAELQAILTAHGLIGA
jgi:hypothetical protein